MTGRPDPLGAVLAAVVIGGAAGGAVVCLGLVAFYPRRLAADPAFADLAIGAGAAGLLTAALVALAIARPAGPWRAVVAAMAGVSLAALLTVLTAVADQAAGRLGLLVLAGLCVAIILGARRLFLGPAAA